MSRSRIESRNKSAGVWKSEKCKAMRFNFFREFAAREMGRRGILPDTVDVDAHFDAGVSLEENKSHFLNDVLGVGWEDDAINAAAFELAAHDVHGRQRNAAYKAWKTRRLKSCK